MSAKERLKEFVKYKGMGRNRFEELVGISSGYISTGSPSIGSEIIEKIARIYPDLNIEWLIMGNGKMIKDPYRQSKTDKELIYKKLMHVPLVSRYGQAEYLDRHNDKQYVDALPTLPVIAEHEGRGEYMCFEVRGDSMNDGSINSYTSGDILICREITLRSVRTKMFFNAPRLCVIIHKEEGIVVKQIMSCDAEKNEITIHSLNPLYEDCAMLLNDVKKLFNVIKLHRQIN
jgi:transcriptional regulator with XRE-family HTH domain